MLTKTIMQPKYTLSDASEKEQQLFMQEFNELLNKFSLYYEPVPQFSRDSLTSPWKIVCQVFLQKKTIIEESENTEVIKSPDEFNPATS